MPEPLPEIPLRERVVERVIPSQRLVVGVCADPSKEGWFLVACQDGTLFRYTIWSDDHIEVSPIPGTPRHYQQLGAAMEAREPASVMDGAG